MTRPDRVARLIRLIAVNEAIKLTTSHKQHAALRALAVKITNDVSDKDYNRITKARRQLSKAASELVLAWAEDTP